MDFDKIDYYADCSQFKGYIPCAPHKETGVHCKDCSYYSPKKDKILIIKLGAIGDVIRTTPLLHKLIAEHPESELWWLTYSPEIVPSVVHKTFKFNSENILLMEETEFGAVVNLDKDTQACALAKRLKSGKLYGFTLVNGRPAPANELAHEKFLTGLFDDVNKANKKSYPEEIFEICGYKFQGEEYILDIDNSYSWDLGNEGKTIVGLNTGCGDRWVSRLWAEEKWIELISMIKQEGMFPLLLGGKQEHEKNLRMAERSGACYKGHFSLQQFLTLVNQCDIVVTAVTMALHIAVGLKKKVVLMNNIFNPAEFELYGRGEIVMPDRECTCYFSPACRNKEYFCMDSLHAQKLMDSVKRLA